MDRHSIRGEIPAVYHRSAEADRYLSLSWLGASEVGVNSRVVSLPRNTDLFFNHSSATMRQSIR